MSAVRRAMCAGERGTAFSVRPASGVIPAFSELDCQVVFHPSFAAPPEADFFLQVHGGNQLRLRSLAKVRLHSHSHETSTSPSPSASRLELCLSHRHRSPSD